MPSFLPGLTLPEAITWVASSHPRSGYTFQDSQGNETFVSWVELERLTRVVAGQLAALGLRARDTLGLMLIDPAEFVLAFLGASRIGVVPVPLYPPGSSATQTALSRMAHILDSSGARVVLTSRACMPALSPLRELRPALRISAMSRDELTAPTMAELELPRVQPNDTAFLQYTSGSVAEPKGVVVTHRALEASCRGMAAALDASAPRDKLLSWLPLYHDMGLVGFVLTPVFTGIASVLMPTSRFMRNPTSWLDGVHRHRATITFCAPFALQLVLRRLADSDAGAWDVSCVRAWGVGAEPINVGLLRAFATELERRCRLPPSVVTTAYGMAEATLAIGIKRHGATLMTRRAGGGGTEHVSCGVPLPGHELRIRRLAGDALGGEAAWEEAAPGVEGEICVRGPTVATGYYRNDRESRAVFRHTWLHTGDVGFVHDGEVYVTSRLKELVVINGRNFHPHAFEATAATVPGVRAGRVVAFSRPGTRSEELVMVCEGPARAAARIAESLMRTVALEHGVEVSDVVVLHAGSLPTTSSGKLQRRTARDLYLSGAFTRPSSAIEPEPDSTSHPEAASMTRGPEAGQ